MFRKSKTTSQLDVFTSSSSFLTGKSLNLFDDENAWHNQFRMHVTQRIDEEIFLPLYADKTGTPNSSIRILVSMMILKEAEGMSDEKLFENCRFNLLVRSALGLVNLNDRLPTESTYYLFRKRVADHAEEGGENLIEKAFAQVTQAQCDELGVKCEIVRMDSKLLGSNICWLSRYELIHETFRLFYKDAEFSHVPEKLRKELDELLKIKGNKVVYTHSTTELN